MSEPVKTKNLDDQYGSAALPWSRARDLLATQTPHENLTFFVGTVRPDGRPHAAGVGAIWVDDALWFVSGPRTRRARNLAANPACSVSVRLRGLDLTMEGEAHRVADPETLERVAAVYREGGWPATVGLLGSREDVAAKAREYAEAGIDELAIVPATSDADPGGGKTLAACRSAVVPFDA